MEQAVKAPHQLRTRAEIDPADTWAIERIYPDQAAWEADFARLRPLMQDSVKYEGHLGDGWQVLADCLRWQEELGRLLEKLYIYAAMRRDEDNGNALYQGLRDRMDAVAVEAGTRLAFFAPQLMALPEDRLQSYLQQPELQLYRRLLEDMLREKAHLLSPSEERLLAGMGEITGAFDNIYSLLTDADLQFPVLTREDGRQEQLSHGNYILFMKSRDRAVRRAAFDAMYDTYAALGNTMASLYAASVKKDNYLALVHRHPSALAAALFGDNIAIDVYTQLIAAVRRHLPDLHEYLRRRKRLLQVDELHMYDLYVPLYPELKLEFDWPTAQRTVLQALAPLGEQYVADLQAGYAARWVDVYENQGKTSGAYSGGVYDSDPYMLLNFTEDINGVQTLAHESGHSMHSFYTRKTQPYVYGDYRIFVAEVASTVNENLLSDYLLARAETKDEVNYLVNHYLEDFRATVFRQTMFAEFELAVHQKAQEGEPLTAESLCELYYRLNCDYFGAEVCVDEKIAWEWARIPHFYRAYYVYQYATGFCAASALALGLLDEDPQRAAAARERYLRFLAAGSTRDPIDLLADAGVDMTSAEPLEAALTLFGKMVKRYE